MAIVAHLAAVFDFTGEDNVLYRTVNPSKRSMASLIFTCPSALATAEQTLMFARLLVHWHRRRRAVRKVLRILVFGDTDEGEPPSPQAASLPPAADPGAPLGRRCSVPWNLALSAAAIGAYLMLSRLVLGSDEMTANAHTRSARWSQQRRPLPLPKRLGGACPELRVSGGAAMRSSPKRRDGNGPSGFRPSSTRTLCSLLWR